MNCAQNAKERLSLDNTSDKKSSRGRITRTTMIKHIE